MARALKWAESAWSDLEEIAEYIDRDSPYYAATFVASVRKAAQSLLQFPERGRVVPEFGEPSLREVFVQRYRIIYQFADETICILGVVHGVRDLLSAWSPPSDTEP